MTDSSNCPICGLPLAGTRDPQTGWITGHSREDCLRERLWSIKARLYDDDLATRIGKDCHDPHHDPRWCPTCEARLDGIDAYRQAVLGKEKAAQ